MKRETVIVLILAISIVCIALFMIGGAIQDVNYHKELDLGAEITEEKLIELQTKYDSLQSRINIGRALQIVGSVATLISFVFLAVFSIKYGIENGAKTKKAPDKKE